jgi:phage protein D
MVSFSGSASIGGAIGGGAAGVAGGIGGAVGDVLAAGDATVRAQVKIGFPMAAPLNPLIEPQLSRVVVDTHLHLPGMFELWFLDEEGTVLETAGLSIGQVVEIHGGAATDTEAKRLIVGEVTSLEAVCADLYIYSVARGYEKDHRLQRAKRSRTFLNMKDSDIAQQIASEAGLTVGTVDATATTHDHIAQVTQTDYEFLKQRAREIGYETGVEDDQFYFRKASGNTKMGSGGGLLGAVASAAAGALGLGGGSELTFKDNLLVFRPRLTGANITPEVEVRVWDSKGAKVVVGTATAETGTADLENKPDELADSFGGMQLPIPIPPVANTLLELMGLPSLGAPPSGNAHVVTNRPLAAGPNASAAADEAALGVAEHIASSFAEAEGVAMGHPDIQAGKSVTIKSVPKPFEGVWYVTQARHVFDEEEEAGYVTRFTVSGRQDRSLLGLTMGGGVPEDSAQINGLVCGVVTNNNDPDKLGRVKVTLPWLSPSFETDWARVVQFGLGIHTGAVFLPEVGDEVLVGCEFGDARRPYVLGGLWNSNTKVDLGGQPVKAQGMTGTVVKRGFLTPSGSRLVFDDELAPPPAGQTAPPLASAITLGSKDDKLVLKIDQIKGTIDLLCEPAPPASQAVAGTVTIKIGGPGSKLAIETGPTGTIDIKTGAGGTVNVDGGAQLNLKAQATVKIESTGMLELKGNPIKLN